MPRRSLDFDELRRIVADLVEEDPDSIEEGANLFTLGLDSIALMQLVGRWRQTGIDVDFAELSKNPTVGAWAKLLSEREAALGAGARTASCSDADVEFPLAVMQHAYWLGRRDVQRLGGVGSHLYTEFDGSGVDPDRLQVAVEQLVSRHDMLRVRITEDGHQRIETQSGWRGLAVHDLRDLDHEKLDTQLELIRKELSHQTLDIQSGEVFSTALSLLPGGRTRLHLDVDMVAADAVSYRILLADLARFYEQPDATFPALAYSYREYRAARTEARSAAAQQAAVWWQDRLPDLPGAPDFPLVSGLRSNDFVGPVLSARRYFTLSAQRYAKLTELSRRRGLTPAMVMATAFAEVVGTWSTQHRFLLNVPLFDRDPVHPDVNKIIGDFSGSVLLEVDLTEPVDFTNRVQRLQSRMHTDAAHADYSGVEVLRDLTRLHGEQVLAPVVFTSALSLGELFDIVVRRNFGDPVWIISQNPQVLLDTQIIEMDGGLLVNWDVREQEFSEGVVDAMFTAFKQFVHRLTENETVWEEPVGKLLPMCQQKIRERVNDTTVPFRKRLLHEDFFAVSRKSPEAVALLWDEHNTLSYGALADRALRVANALQDRGVQPGEAVGVSLPKGPDQVVAVLGVLAAGGVYVPISVDQPALRRVQILRAAGVRVVLDEATLPLTQCAVPLEAPVPRSPDELAYLIFTSGSTGEPKGVKMSHRAVMNTIDDINSRHQVSSMDRVLAVSALDFDLSVYDIFGLLCVGGAVVCIGEDQRRDAVAWNELVARHKVTIWNTVPQLLEMLLTAASSAEALASLRISLVSGDWVGLDLSARLAALAPQCRLIALGGATEAAIWSNAINVPVQIPPQWKSVPYGFPLANQCYRVVDGRGRDCPDWVAGELWIGGAGLADGYCRDAERTMERFVFSDDRRWYRTGDLGRYWPDGTLEFLGRTDFQVKLRGYRIELGEIEAVLRAHKNIGHAVAAVVGKEVSQLAVAVTTSASLSSVDPDDLRQWAAGRLPSYMVPERVLVLDTVPVTRNGKIDRREVRRILAAEGVVQAVTFESPCNAVEKAVAQIWSEVLGVGQIGRGDSFFALGGDSLLATRVITRLRSINSHDAALRTLPDVTIADLYRHTTLASLAAYLGTTAEGSDELDRVVARARLQRRVRQSRAAGSSRKETNNRA